MYRFFPRFVRFRQAHCGFAIQPPKNVPQNIVRHLIDAQFLSNAALFRFSTLLHHYSVTCEKKSPESSLHWLVQSFGAMRMDGNVICHTERYSGCMCGASLQSKSVLGKVWRVRRRPDAQVCEAPLSGPGAGKPTPRHSFPTWAFGGFARFFGGQTHHFQTLR